MTELPPHDLAAEQVVLGAMMLSDGACDDAAEHIDAGDHFRPAHQIVHETIMDLYLNGLPHDPVAVGAALEDAGTLSKAGGGSYLHTLMAAAPASAVAGFYAKRVAVLATRRRWAEAGIRIQQIAQTGEDEDELDSYASLVAGEVDAARLFAGRNDHGELLTASAFAGVKRDRRPAVIPGLMDHEDRLVVVGVPGEGKTTWLFQIGFAAAAGCHPFTAWPIPAVNVLIVDLENRPGILARKFDRFLAIAERYPGWDGRRIRVWSERAGLDLRMPADQGRLAQVLRKAKADLVIAGPINKMLVEDDTRGSHQTVARWWDRMQERHGFALCLEHHPPMKQNLGKRREIRGAGSAIWEQWPEFTILLEPAGPSHPAGSMRLGRQRGDREEGRLWPERIERQGRFGGGDWPWVAVYPDGTIMDPETAEPVTAEPVMDGAPF